jgi:hypothetical protein
LLEETLSHIEMIRALQKRGYVVRHKDEAPTVLSWNRVEPMPDGLNFEAEALAKIKAQITADMLEFTDRPDNSGLTQGIRTAKLRILR